MAGLGWQELVMLTALFVYAWVGYWIYHDANRRGMSGIAWLFVRLVFQVIGLIVYLIVRPSRPTRSA